MSQPYPRFLLALVLLGLTVAGAARAQGSALPLPPPPPGTRLLPSSAVPTPSSSSTSTATPAGAPEGSAARPAGEGLPPERTSSAQTQPGTDVAQPLPGPAPVEPDTGKLLDGRRRQGAFLSGPGSLTFILHHTAMGAAGGFFTQGFANEFSWDLGSREAMLAGTLIGAGLGFGSSAWWQHNHWVDTPAANFGVVNSLIGGLFLAGFMDLLSDSSSVLTWSTFIGTELGAWLTMLVGGGQMPLADGLLVASGGAWAGAFSALLAAIVHFSGTRLSSATWRDTLLIAPGVGAAALAFATMRYSPTASQVLRADIFGGAVGAAVLVLSGLVLDFDKPTPYVLAFLGSTGAITTVSLLWEESAEGSAALYRAPEKPYRNVWW